MAEAVVKIVAPYLGETMARSAVRAHCQKLGIDGPDVSPPQLDALIGRLGAGLNIFIGREKSSSVVEELRRVLGDGAKGRP